MTIGEDDRSVAARRLLGLRLREARLQARLQLPDAAEASGVSMAHLSDCERGRKWLSLEALVRVADAYGVLVTDLLHNVYPFGTRRRPKRLPGPPADGRTRPT